MAARTERMFSAAPCGRDMRWNGYATSTVVMPGERGPTSLPRTSVSGATSATSTWIQTSASTCDSLRISSFVLHIRLLMGSRKQHRIAVTVESIPLGNGCHIRRTKQINAGKCADQEQQRRARQVEVGHQG